MLENYYYEAVFRNKISILIISTILYIFKHIFDYMPAVKTKAQLTHNTILFINFCEIFAK